MIDEYFGSVEQIVLAFPKVRSLSINKKSYNLRQGYISGSVVFENRRRLDFVEVKDIEVKAKIKYRYQYMDPDGKLIFRYDNAPHHPELSGFPNHKHHESGIVPCVEPALSEILMEIAERDRLENRSSL